MRYAMIFTVLGLSLGSMAADAADANDAHGIHDIFDWHDIHTIQDLQNLIGLDYRWGNNPCERVGGACEPLGATFCRGALDVTVNLPCRANIGTPLVGCCWH
ncbi:hypothetical protein J3F83DRAFT_733655, partial [Trichoderma novae-zelandiae]